MWSIHCERTDTTTTYGLDIPTKRSIDDVILVSLLNVWRSLGYQEVPSEAKVKREDDETMFEVKGFLRGGPEDYSEPRPRRNVWCSRADTALRRPIRSHL